ncbi:MULTISPECIES: helix-turn-helix domain-containing protein [Cellulophaga]|uniref:Transcriptional regulator, AraC family n=2 Tax=Cellulophaga TaxID=104264 RepID=F0RI12_CELLC|nr:MULTISPECIES: AraC family transcriptional regulator [Cellulophaga]ADY30293.1 transcriptional regulator, AraC family [Cellulophaga lytica DSM 7489]AIM61281.1 AraC family transcriptional regulator [Cellulophaga lytica]APU11186.1 AraC family transcriptional regulator [Cellulophaga lytica]EWH14382.1 AraC family transcriptional regulator [Cellulophaga geojensis KL-A]MDO6854629.1 AraC family transcriptional regulator [Cellulophaga lytica]
MKMNLKFDYNFICKTILQEQLGALNLEYKIHSLSEVEFKKKPTETELQYVTQALEKYGITIIVDQQSALVQRIKELITELINDTEKSRKYNASDYLSEKLNYSYAHLSSVFSETTYSSIENFIILKKIDLAKELIIHKNYTLTEIAHELNYSSVAHLSAQFKKTTGLTPSAFQRIINKRKKNE